MRKKLIGLFKTDSLWIQVFATLVAAIVIWLITILYGVVKGMDYKTSIEWSLGILEMKVSLTWFIVFLMVFVILLKRSHINLLNEINELTYSKQEIDKKNRKLESELSKKNDISVFQRFSDKYDYRRLKNHPWHDQYSNDGVETFIKMIEEGNQGKDKYKLENGMIGLIKELEDDNFISSSQKNRVLNQLKENFTDQCMHEKDILIQKFNS
ncbi:MAG: hypothetical protein RIE52_04840 [Balneola sp.]